MRSKFNCKYFRVNYRIGSHLAHDLGLLALNIKQSYDIIYSPFLQEQ
jgi:hypothetical protein